jgi:peptidoglycan hydrolase-like protein with peptidoglycan-binding domain
MVHDERIGATPMADPIIKLGSTGPAVKKAQQNLICRGQLLPGTDDGVFGNLTVFSVILYQIFRRAGEHFAFSFPLNVDGIVGPKTWARLAPAQIKKGSKGNGVRLCQEILKYLADRTGFPSYDPGPIDGDFGPKADAAVQAFQGHNSDSEGHPLQVDGIVGPKTWCALRS